MKKLVAVVLLLITCYSFADDSQAAGFQNNAGGWTVITTRDQYCSVMDMHDGYAFGTESYVRFCWTRRGNAILVVFESGENRTWPAESFQLLPTEPEYKSNKTNG
jgi:hypothetical protein